MEGKKEISLEVFNDFIALCEKKGFSIKDAIVGNKRKEYIKQKEFNELIKKHQADFEQFFKGTVYNIADIENMSNEIISLFVKNDFLKDARASIHEAKLKYPKRLIPLYEYLADNNNQDEEKPRRFYYFTNERKEKKSYFWLGAAIIGVLAYCLFPLWPLEVKLGIWWVSWILSVVMIGLLLLRLLIFLIFYTFGYSIWIFPNLTDDKLGVIESFKPFLSKEKRNDPLYKILIRIAIASSIVYAAYEVYMNPNLIQDGIDHLFEIYSDVLSYGNDKIINYYNTTSISIVDKNNIYMDKIMKEGLGVEDF